jgi:hypothetical protein
LLFGRMVGSRRGQKGVRVRCNLGKGVSGRRHESLLQQRRTQAAKEGAVWVGRTSKTRGRTTDNNKRRQRRCWGKGGGGWTWMVKRVSKICGRSSLVAERRKGGNGG